MHLEKLQLNRGLGQKQDLMLFEVLRTPNISPLSDITLTDLDDIRLLIAGPCFEL